MNTPNLASQLDPRLFPYLSGYGAQAQGPVPTHSLFPGGYQGFNAIGTPPPAINLLGLPLSKQLEEDEKRKKKTKERSSADWAKLGVGIAGGALALFL